MAQVITIAGERLFALKAQNNEQLDVDTFIFANVLGQDPNAAIDRNEGLPPVDQIVHQQIVQQVGRVNDNVVIYSTVMDSLTGPFDFNWVGLYSSVNQTLIAVSHIPSVSKTITVPGAAGNTLNRNFGIEYSGIADLTGITVAPETWQLDFTARLSGMDELTRQLAADMNGKDWFIGDGFKVEPRSTANTFNVTAGAGYVSGLRVELKQDHILTLQSYPQFVYVDAWFDGDASSKWSPKTTFTVTNGEMDDYIDVNGKPHYVFKLARITAADIVEDFRNIEGLAKKIENLEIKSIPTEKYKDLKFSEVSLSPNSHLGLTSGLVETDNGELLLFTRKAGAHAKDPSGKIVVYKTTRGGREFNFLSEQVVLDSGGVDDRDFALGKMNNGRIGLMVGRWDAASSPVFVYSDDNGATWNISTIYAAAPQFFTWFSILPMEHVGPNSFILYGSIEGTWDGIRYLRTDDNGGTWSYGVSLAEQGGILSEGTVAKVATNKWIMVCRQNVAAGMPFILSESTDMINFTQIGTILNGGQNPPYLLETDIGVELLISMRSGSSNHIPELKNKIIGRRVLSKDAVNGDYSAWSDVATFDRLISLDRLLGYVQFTKSNQGTLYAAIAFRQSDDATTSKLAIITDELSLESNASIQLSQFEQESKWTIISDKISQRKVLLNNEIELHYVDDSALQAILNFPVEFTSQASLPSVFANINSLSSTSLIPNNLGVLRIDLISNTSARFTLFAIDGYSFNNGDKCKLIVRVDGESYLGNDL
jgi:hypothetical protein